MNTPKSLKSKDGNLEVRYDDVTHVCIAPNTYPLIQYLLLMDDDVVFHHTYYFLDDTVSSRIRSILPCYECKHINKSIVDKIMKRIHKIRFRFLRSLYFPFLKTAEIYAFDLPYLNICIGNRSYQLLADAPHWLTLNMQSNSQTYIRHQIEANSLMGKVRRFIWGNQFLNYFGNNNQCKVVHLTEENQSPVLDGKNVYVNSLSSMWNTASEIKKNFILKLIDVTEADMRLLSGRPYVFFSQPLVYDCGLTEVEYVEILQKIFQNYPPEDMIIKTHPRDHFNYRSFFPKIELFTKPVNSQLLLMMGYNPRKVITICSTAIEGFPESVECDYYSANVHPKVLIFMGKEYKPARIVNFKDITRS